MRVRTLLTLTAIVSMTIGAVIVYLVLTVPNDVEAAALLRNARRHIAAGDDARARQSLEQIVQQFPRTDAAAAATVALASLADHEQKQMMSEIAGLRRETEVQQKQISVLAARVDELAARPVPQPPVAAPKKTASRRRRRH